MQWNIRAVYQMSAKPAKAHRTDRLVNSIATISCHPAWIQDRDDIFLVLKSGRPSLSPAVMRYLGLLLLVPLAGCSYTTYLSGADEHGGTVNMVTELTKDDAIQKANAHCQQYNRVARVTNTDPQSNTLTFSCDEPLER